MTPILTATVGTNADLFPNALALYSKPGDRILDMTWGLGVFWRNVDQAQYDLKRNDMDPDRGDWHFDFRDTEWYAGFFDAVVLDPPYASRSGSPMKASIDRGYNNGERALVQGIYGTDAVMQFYEDGMIEARRILKPDGVLYLKCMDEIMGGKQRRNHIHLWKAAVEMGFADEDLFVLVQNGTPTMRHNYQLHARKNNSFLWVFRKPRTTTLKPVQDPNAAAEFPK